MTPLHRRRTECGTWASSGASPDTAMRTPFGKRQPCKSCGSVLVEAALAIFLLASLAAGTAGTLISAIRLDRAAAVNIMADACIDIEAAKARRLPLVDSTSFALTSYSAISPAVTTSSVTVGRLFDKDIPGTMTYTRIVTAVEPSGNEHRLIIGLSYKVSGRTYLKTREVTRYEN